MPAPTIRRFTPPTCTLEVDNATKIDTEQHFHLSFDDPCLSEAQQVTVKGNRQQLERLYKVISDRLQQYLSATFSPEISLDDNNSNSEIQLQMRSLDSDKHQLVIDFAEHNNAALKIDLTTVQLFDLVTALEAYSNEAKLSPSQPQRKRILVWGSCAATVAIAIGLVTVGIRSDRSSEPVTTSPAASNQTIPEFETVVPPQVAEPEAAIVEPQLDEPISSAEKLPPPLPVDAPKPQPDIPDPADFPPSEPLDLSALEPPASPSQTDNDIPEAALEPQPSTDNSSQIETELPSDTPAENPQSIPEDNLTQTDLDDAEAVDKERSPEQATASNNSNSDNPAEIAPNTQNSDRPSSNDNSELALNSSNVQSQLQQVEQYFQETWQPPEQLTETLQYRLKIDRNGAIARIFPIGKAAEVYLDRTNIPLMGDPFIDPLTNQQLTVRLMLSPDGEVNTFAE